MKKTKTWLLAFGACTAAGMIAAASVTVYIDPFMHYHKPLTDRYYYVLDNQRSQNDGITVHFDYDGVITGTSEIENTRTSEAERLFGGSWIKVPYAGGMYSELNSNLEKALKTHPHIKNIVRCLDRYKIIADKDADRKDMGSYPTYLYDSNPFNDVDYLFNRDVLYTTEYRMEDERRAGWDTGITSFDDYSRWMDLFDYGKNCVLKWTFGDDWESASFTSSEDKDLLTDDERELIRENITQNVTDLAEEYPDTDFYYFLPPYSAAFWGTRRAGGHLERQLEEEELMISLILPHENIHLFAWDRFDLFDDLNNYRDSYHYAEWINSWMLVQMKKDAGRLTEDNYEDYLKRWYDHYKNFDYGSLFDQVDYEANYFAGALLNQEITGAQPLHLDAAFLEGEALQGAAVTADGHGTDTGLDCTGTMSRTEDSDTEVYDACYDGDYAGVRFTMDVTDYRALTFYGRKVSGDARPSVYVYDAEGNVLRSLSEESSDPDDQWHQYALNLAGIYGDVTVIMNGGATDSSGAPDSEYIFSDIYMM